MTEAIVAVCVSVAASVSAVALIAKRMSFAAAKQNEAYIEQGKVIIGVALDNMKANTEAIKANSSATSALASSINQMAAIRDERDRALFKQLDRIEFGRRKEDGR